MISQFFPQKSLPNFVCTKSKVCRHPPSQNYRFLFRSKLDKTNISVHLQKTIISVRSWRLHLQNLAWPMVQMSRNLAKSGKFIAICDEIFNTKLLALHLSSWEEFSHFLLFFSTISSLNLHRKFFVILRFQRILASFKMIVDSKLKRLFESTEASSKKVFTTLNNCLLILNCPPSHFFVTPYIPTSNTHSPHVVRVFFPKHINV